MKTQLWPALPLHIPTNLGLPPLLRKTNKLYYHNHPRNPKRSEETDGHLLRRNVVLKDSTTTKMSSLSTARKEREGEEVFSLSYLHTWPKKGLTEARSNANLTSKRRAISTPTSLRKSSVDQEGPNQSASVSGKTISTSMDFLRNMIRR